MIGPGDIVSYIEMCADVGVTLQRGMNFRLRNGLSVILMSVRPDAPYHDQIQDAGRTLIYEGHDIPQYKGGPNPKDCDQPMVNPGGSLTQNGQFFHAADKIKNAASEAEFVRVFEKIRDGIWVYNGLFSLIDAYLVNDGKRNVFKFRLEVVDNPDANPIKLTEIPHTRVIPSSVKVDVWKRDKGRCVKCGSTKNLHFDHVLPYSLGGASIIAANVQLLCAQCNLAKSNKIE